MKNNNLKYLCLSAVFSGIIFIFTAYFHIPSHTGYTHIGDGFIYLAACLLPTPYAIFAAALASFLADYLSGFVIWAPASVIIKALTVLFFSSKSEKTLTKRNLLALIPAALLCLGGYYFYDALIFSNFISAATGIIGYITQSVLSSALFIFIGTSFDKINFKKYLGE